MIICGHTKGSLALGLLGAHPRGRTPARAGEVFRIADNQTATLAEWNMDLLPMV